MTAEERITLLHQFLEEDPKDPFNSYALAMAYFEQQPSLAQQYFEMLLSQHPSYLPTYYHAAILYNELGETERVEEIYKKGIALATVQQNAKAIKELKQAYQNFLFEI